MCQLMTILSQDSPKFYPNTKVKEEIEKSPGPDALTIDKGKVEEEEGIDDREEDDQELKTAFNE